MLDRFRLDGRIAIVTGASSGLGIAFAQALAEVGATVVPVLVQRLVALKALIDSKGSHLEIISLGLPGGRDRDGRLYGF
jgi:NAD(P)-dependent dehydrogenase (short-subunit alcohol dehydrogenase family)